MPQSCVLVFVHYVWATWDRLPMLTPAIEARVHACIAAKCRELGSEPLQIGGTEDHVHALVSLPSTITVAELARGMKGASSHLTARELTSDGFKWQGSYGAFSVSQEHIPRVRAYIARQKEHHDSGDLEPAWERCFEVPDV